MIDINSSKQTSRHPKGLKVTMTRMKDKHMISRCSITITMMATTMNQELKMLQTVIATIKVMMAMEMSTERTNKMNL